MARPITADELRETFLRFFEERGHLRMPSASLIPAGDPTLLLTNSGMAQFKAYFAGEVQPPHGRVTTVQKCFRTTDIEEVGDATHLTLFEMLGNFSFGDYFKKEACAWALELMQDVLHFEPERLYFTIYEDDDEAEQIWLSLGIPPERIYRFGDEDNWWGPAGDEGPCGPSSEINYYRGDLAKVPGIDDPVRKSSWGPNLHSDFVELYNLVFTQFYHHSDGRRTVLPNKNIDTGMGLERTVAALQGVANVYETDIFRPLIAKAEAISGKKWGDSPEINRALSVVAEHSRSASFLIGDGVVPGNTGRGYVLRRLVRRGMLFGRSLGLNSPFLSDMSRTVTDVMGHAYPELVNNGPFIREVLEQEEESFSRTLEFGSMVLEGMTDYRANYRESLDAIAAAVDPSVADNPRHLLEVHGFTYPHGDEAHAIGRRAAADALADLVKDAATGARDDMGSLRRWADEISGREAFLLYDTYGFPFEVTRELLEEKSLKVDQDEFSREMDAQRARGRAAGAKFGGDSSQRRVYEEIGIDETKFLGYETTTADSVVDGLIKAGRVVESASEGDEVEIILRETPFYAERGGQIGDAGVIRSKDSLVEVINTRSPYGHVNAHYGTVRQGQIKIGDAVTAEVDAERRERIRRNHTATHLVHAALREIVGTHVRQAGSLVAPDRLRFDFTHMSPLTPEQIKAVQDRVNEKIRENVGVQVHWTTYGEAIEEGALAFFGDKYENEVRTIKIDAPWSYELCGGTHMDRTGGIGTFVIVSETGIGSGMRRLEAITGKGTEEAIWERFGTVDRLSSTLRAPLPDLETRTKTVLTELDGMRRKVADLEEKLLQASLGGGDTGESQSFSVEVDGTNAPVQVNRVPATTADALRRTGDHLRNRIGSGILVLGSVIEERPVVVVMVTQDLTKKGFHAGNIAKGLASIMGGGGGGRPDVAQAGGRDAAKLDEALASVGKVIEGIVGAPS
ncbi:MAG: alanine--tRNA ligase [Dehalococcoidia bacterium]